MPNPHEGISPVKAGIEVSADADHFFVGIMGDAYAHHTWIEDRGITDPVRAKNREDAITDNLVEFIETHGELVLNAVMDEYRSLNKERARKVDALVPYVVTARERIKAAEESSE